MWYAGHPVRLWGGEYYIRSTAYLPGNYGTPSVTTKALKGRGISPIRPDIRGIRVISGYGMDPYDLILKSSSGYPRPTRRPGLILM